MQSETQTESESRIPENRYNLSLGKLAVPLSFMVIFWALAIWMWLMTGMVEPLLHFGYLGTSLGGGFALYAALPKKKKPLGRKLAQFLIGFYMLVVMGVMMFNNVQIEGVFFTLLTGAFGAAMFHYLIAKMIGPIIFGRLWCGWACWTPMILDTLPYVTSKGRVSERWGYFRYIHFILSFVVVVLSFFFIGEWVGLDNTITALYWLLVGNLLYYAIGIILAIRYKDNRAFCKYVCPTTTFLKIGTRLSLVKVKGNSDKCTQCGACDRACPMDIEVSKYTKMGTRVLSTECILCQTCISSCPHDVLSLSFGLDRGGTEFLRKIEQI